MQFPQINLNGTDGETLRNEYFEAYRSVSAAVAALERVTVHGRDYQTLGRDALQQALIEHRERLDKLRSVERDLAAITQELTEQTKARSRG